MREAVDILAALNSAESRLLGKNAATFNGQAGTIAAVFLDGLHGLTVQFSRQSEKWPVATLKHIEDS